MEIERVHANIHVHEEPVVVHYMERLSPAEIRCSTHYVDFIVKVSESLLRMMPDNELMEYIKSALPPSYRNYKFSIKQLSNNYERYGMIKTFGITMQEYTANVYSPSETKTWIYCPSCGAPLKNHRCEYCGLQL